jgi:membrane protease subunit (stomatin/prohibitin family)
MSLWSRFKSHASAQFLDVVEWLDDSDDTLVWRFPVFNQAITDNSKLVVREGQAAVFVSEGKLSDVFAPGTYTLDTRNAPILSFFESIKYQFEYPYKGDIYFVSTRQFTDNGWGTQKPFMMRDAEFGPVRIRAFGVYSFRLTDPGTFLKQVVGTDGLFTTDEITGQLKKKLVSMVASSIGKAQIPVLDLAAQYMEIGDQIRQDINPAFQSSYGITLSDVTISNIGLPEAVEKALDTRSKMGVLGNLDAYAKLQAADAMAVAAANPGLAGAGVGMGVGFGMGNAIGGALGGAQAAPGHFDPRTGSLGAAPPATPPPPAPSTFHYSGPSGQHQLGAEQIAERVAADRSGNHQVWQAGWAEWKAWSDVPAISSQVPPAPAAPPPVHSEPSFHYHGPSGQSEKTLSEIVDLIQADPSGTHNLWANGWPGWKPAAEVPEVAQALAADTPPPPPSGGPPPPPM